MRTICALLLIGALTFVSGGANPKKIDRLGDIFAKEIAPYKDQIASWAIRLVTDRPTLQAEYLTCDVCPLALNLARQVIDLGGTDEEITRAVAKACELFNLAPVDDICFQTIYGYVIPISYMLKNSRITTDDFCGLINENCGTINATFTAWETTVAGGKPESIDRPSLPVS